jgi:catechol 2,3-dioxygenase-like lactoylglutathione lyase family enzyme
VHSSPWWKIPVRGPLRLLRGGVAAATIVLALTMAGSRLGTHALGAVGAADGAVASTGVSAVVSVGMTVADMDRAVDFYTRVLPFRKIYETEASGRPWEQLHGVFGARVRVVGLQLGDERLELTEYLAPRGRPMPPDTRGNDRWFQHVAIVVRDMDRAYAHLQAHGVVHASTAPQRLPDWNPGAGGIQAFYFRDPDGHFLEVLAFPAGKGDPKWREPGETLFLGLDHTAIVVADTDRALAFYRDTLGLRVAGEGENHGIEQERLNNVFGVRLRITTLRAAAGTGVELLDYRAPRDGRDAPADLKANDVAHWQITMRAAGVARLLRPSPAFSLVSPDVTALDLPHLSFDEALLIRDPDGHAVRVVR